MMKIKKDKTQQKGKKKNCFEEMWMELGGVCWGRFEFYCRNLRNLRNLESLGIDEYR